VRSVAPAISATASVVAAPMPSSITSWFACSHASRIAPRREVSERDERVIALFRQRSAISAAFSPPACPPTPSATASTPRSESSARTLAASSLAPSLSGLRAE
jgi:hypothetical protein